MRECRPFASSTLLPHPGQTRPQAQRRNWDSCSRGVEPGSATHPLWCQAKLGEGATQRNPPKPGSRAAGTTHPDELPPTTRRSCSGTSLPCPTHTILPDRMALASCGGWELTSAPVSCLHRCREASGGHQPESLDEAKEEEGPGQAR